MKTTKILIKNSPNSSFLSIKRQISPAWKMFDEGIVFTDNDADDYDWVVVMHHSALTKKFVAKVPRSRCIYISMEPSEEMCGVSTDFINQFGCVVASDPKIKHDYLIKLNAHSWWVGLNVCRSKSGHQIQFDGSIDYAYFKNTSFSNKINKVSVISSSNPHLPGHTLRDDLIKHIVDSEVSNYVDVFGRGYKPFSDKITAIAPYKYHLVIENFSGRDYWSEKIADSFLCDSFPIYYGCSNIKSYFSPESLVLIDTLDPQKVVAQLKYTIQNPLIKLSNEALQCSKSKILDDYNIFTIIYKICINKEKVRGSHKLFTNSYFRHGYAYSTARRLIKTVVNKL